MLKYKLWLHGIEGIGAVAIRKIMDTGATPADLFQFRDQTIENMSFLTTLQRQKLIEAKKIDPDSCLEALQKSGMHFVTWDEAVYPARLLQLKDAPYGLYYLGNLPQNDTPLVGIVGARNCTPYGKHAAEDLSEVLTAHGIGIVSGMARGIDGFAHQGALRAGGNSYAFLGCGADVCYPRENRNIYEKLQQNGGIISEYPPGTQPLGQHFPMRNRLISGISDALLVIEARQKSGSLITVDFALEQGKEVFVLPGPVDSDLSKGPNLLIRQGASIICGVTELLEDLQSIGITIAEKPEIAPQKVKNQEKYNLENEELIVYSEITLRPKSVEMIEKSTGLAIERIRAALVELTLSGRIEEMGVGQYIRK